MVLKVAGALVGMLRACHAVCKAESCISSGKT